MSWVEATDPRLDVTARREKRRLWSRKEGLNGGYSSDRWSVGSRKKNTEMEEQ